MAMMVLVQYIDALQGGAGSLNMELEQVPAWLARSPGVLIRGMTPNVGLTEATHTVYQESVARGVAVLEDIARMRRRD